MFGWKYGKTYPGAISERGKEILANPDLARSLMRALCNGFTSNHLAPLSLRNLVSGEPPIRHRPVRDCR